MAWRYGRILILALTLAGNAGLLNPVAAFAETQPSMEMRAMPGDSYASLAAAIYPDNRAMQQRFISATRNLNRDKFGGRGANEVFDMESSIRIPDLRALSWGAPTGNATDSNKRSSGNGAEARYSKREQELAGLNTRLAELEAQAARVQQLLSENMPPVEQVVREQQATPNPEAGDGKPLRRVMAPETDVLAGDHSMPNWILMGLAGLIVLAALAAYAWHRGRRRPRAATILEAPAAAPYQNPFSAGAPSLGGQAKTSSAAPEDQRISQPATPAPMAIEIDDIAVDEIDSVVEEARVIVAMGRTSNAIRLLVDHLQHHPRASVAAWLYLLELYRATDNRKEFAETGRRMHEHFNVMIPAWDAKDVSNSVPRQLEAFPSVIRRIQESWGSAECLEYLQHLLQDNREGERIGFSSDVMEEILLLQEILIHRDD